MDRGTRLGVLFQSLEKLNKDRLGQKFTAEDIQQLKYLTSKLLQFCAASEKTHRDLIVKNSGYLDQLLLTLEYSNDTNVQHNVVLVLYEILGKSNTVKRGSLLVAHGATHVLFHVLVSESKSPTASDELMVSIHQVLAKVGPKDRKFGVKARLSQALPVTLGMIRSHLSNPKALLHIMHVLKLYSNNVVNSSYLGKNGAITHLFRTFNVCQKRHLSLLKYALDTLGLLVKSKSNSARAIGHGGVPVLLNMFYDWHKFDSKNRHIALRKSILNVLKHITNLKSGRKALTEAEGIRILYTACKESIDSRELESVIFLSSIIMRKCFPKNRLPLSNLRSALLCPLPESDFHVLENLDPQEKASTQDPPSNRLNSERKGDENGYESSVDNDDDLSSDDDPDVQKMESDDDFDGDSGNNTPQKRTWEDLCMYKTFFPELYEFNYVYEDDADKDMIKKDSNSSIVIPTGNDISGLKSKNIRSQTTGPIYLSRKSSSSRHSLPNLSTYDTDNMLDPMRETRLYASTDVDTGQPNLTSTSLSRIGLRRAVLEGRNPSAGCASAVNLHTGSSVFTLGESTLPSANRSLTRTTGQTKSPKGRRKSFSKGVKGKDKRSRKRNQEDWLIEECQQGGMLYKESSVDPEYTEEDTLLDGEDEDGFAWEIPETFAELSSKTKSVGRFNKLAYPEMHGHMPPPAREPLYEKKFSTQRSKIFEDIDRLIHPELSMDRIVYDLDSIVNTAGPTYTCSYSNHSNRDEQRILRQEDNADHLKFNSQFECGNLRKVIQIRREEYDLILNPDVNSNHHHQWFYFEVSNMEADRDYRFNIVNCEKPNSQFNFGMQPVMFSVKEAMKGYPHWRRVGSEICYYKNHFVRSSQTTGGTRGKSYYTNTFTIQFKHEKDVCYLAYHYPYSYTMLQSHLLKWETNFDKASIYYKRQLLTESLGGNEISVLTITSMPVTKDKEGIDQLKNRPYIFLSCRVHPGESNSSWVMKGTINFLMSDKPAAQNLRDLYIFKVIPMLNPDGVINGTHRCSLVGEDLNRRWMHPCPKLHPSIYHTKGLLQFLHAVNKSPLVFCDYHGHSRKKNVFLYGCSPSLSWMQEDLDNPAVIANKIEDTGYKTLPRVLENIAPSFALTNCSFAVEKVKETTARVIVWRQIGVVRSYTMESTYCGCDQGPYKGYHISPREMEEMGRKFCEALVKVKSRHSRAANQLSPLALDKQSSDELLGDPKDCNRLEPEGASAAMAGVSREGREFLSSSSSDCSSNSDQSDDQDNDLENEVVDDEV